MRNILPIVKWFFEDKSPLELISIKTIDWKGKSFKTRYKAITLLNFVEHKQLLRTQSFLNFEQSQCELFFSKHFGFSLKYKAGLTMATKFYRNVKEHGKKKTFLKPKSSF